MLEKNACCQHIDSLSTTVQVALEAKSERCIL